MKYEQNKNGMRAELYVDSSDLDLIISSGRKLIDNVREYNFHDAICILVANLRWKLENFVLNDTR